MELIGVKCNALNLLFDIESYLTEMKQLILVNDMTSALKDIHYGVSQESILKPLFFLNYIIILVKVFKKEEKLYFMLMSRLYF